MGFIQYSSESNVILIRHSGFLSANAAWIYDLETEKLRTINSRKIQAPAGYKVSWVVLLDSYDGESIQIQKSYYTGNFQYINLLNPEIMTYTFF
jgi:prolyl oligopeptidase PreP (S9A serine peptidase family)